MSPDSDTAPPISAAAIGMSDGIAAPHGDGQAGRKVRSALRYAKRRRWGRRLRTARRATGCRGRRSPTKR